MTWREWVKAFLTSRRADGPGHDAKKDPFQMSDLALAWIISEVDLVGQRDPAAAFKWSEDRVGLFGRRYKKHKEQAMGSPIHGSLRFSSGTGLFTVLLWKLLGIPPLFASRYLVRLANKIKSGSL